MKRVEYFLFQLLSRLLSRLPNFILYTIADIVYLFFYYIVGYRKNIVFKNLKNSFPEKSDKEIKQIAIKFYHHLSDIFIENIALIKMKPERVKKMVDYESCKNIITDQYNKNKHVVIVTAHYSNWEFYLTLPILSQHKVLGIYKPLNDSFYDKQFFKMREKFGAFPITMNDSFRTVLKLFKDKELMLVGLIADQRPPKASSNYWTNFLNQETAIFLGPEKIAKKINATLIFTYLEKVKRGKYKMNCSSQLEDLSKYNEYEITELYVRFVEKLIIEKPEYWLWSHNRWKSKRKK